jgi:predicted Fe-Mo cluster-binding NifX family protein
MNIAIPIWNERISPVFDVAQRLVLLTIENEQIIMREEKELGVTPLEKVRLLNNAEVSILICGAISEPLAMQIRQAGVEVICDICGPVSEVAEAYLTGRLVSGRFLMPGCCRRRRFRSCRRQVQERILREDNLK